MTDRQGSFTDPRQGCLTPCASAAGRAAAAAQPRSNLYRAAAAARSPRQQQARSEERRVGKECRSRGPTDHEKNNKNARKLNTLLLAAHDTTREKHRSDIQQLT